MYKDGTLTITDFQKGIAKSPILGNGHIVNSDIFETEGVLKIGKKSEIKTIYNASDINIYGVDALPIASVKIDTLSNPVIYLSNGRLISPSGGNFGTQYGEGFDMIEWNGYLLMSGGNGTTGGIKIGKISLASQTGGQLDTISLGGFIEVISSLSAYPIRFLKSSDNYIYFTNGNKIGRITNITGGDSGNCVATYTSNALDLKVNETATSLTELGKNILIGTRYSGSNPQDKLIANIYPWDRSSSSFYLPVQLQENGVNSMITKDNLVYISAGTNGKIYITNGTTYKELCTIKTSKREKNIKHSFVYVNAMTITRSGKLLVGTSTFYDVTPNKTTFHGIWEIDINTGIYHLAYTIPNLEIGQNSPVSIGFIRDESTEIYFGYKTDTTYKVGHIDFSKLSSIASFESKVLIVGNYSNKKSFNNLEWTFIKPLKTGQKIIIYYRDGIQGTWNSENWVKIHESTSNHIGKYSTIDKAKIANAEVIQLKIELLNTNDSTVESPELLRLILS